MEKTYRTRSVGRGGVWTQSFNTFLWNLARNFPNTFNVFTSQEALGVQRFYCDFIIQI